MTDLTPLMLAEARWLDAMTALGRLYDNTEGATKQAVRSMLDVANVEWRAAMKRVRVAARALLADDEVDAA